jgi:ankyrin repeat protein
MKNHNEIVRLLLQKGAQGSEQALLTGVRRGDPDLVRIALDGGTLRPETLSTAIETAARNNRTEIVEILRQAGAAPRPSVHVEPEVLKAYEGTYRSESGMELSFTFRDGKLIGGPTGQQAVTLLAVDKTTFNAEGVPGVTLVFNLEAAKVVSLTFKQSGSETLLKRVEVRK